MICFYTQIWQRPEITELCFKGMQRLEKEFEKRGVEVCKHAVISEKWAKELCIKYDVTYSICENFPIGRKHNVGLQAAMRMPWSHVIQFNSDTLISNNLVDVYLHMMGQFDLFGFSRITFMNGEDAKINEYATIAGAGRCLSRKVCEYFNSYVEVEALESWASPYITMNEGEKKWVHPSRAVGRCKKLDGPDFKMWPDYVNKGLDDNSNRAIIKAGFSNKILKNPGVYDMKSDVNIWSYDELDGLETTKIEVPEYAEYRRIRRQDHRAEAHGVG